MINIQINQWPTQLPWHEATRSITTPPPRWDAHLLQGYPQVFHQGSLIICWYWYWYWYSFTPFYVTVRVKCFAQDTQHDDLVRSPTHTSRPGVQCTSLSATVSPTTNFKTTLYYKSVSNNINPLLSNISIHILHTPFWVFPLMLTRRICLTLKTSLVGDYFFVFS